MRSVFLSRREGDGWTRALKLRKLWEHDDVSHEGEFFAFESVTINPKPVQQPFPVWIGSWTGTRPAARRIVGTAAGWQASGLHATPEQAVVDGSASNLCARKWGVTLPALVVHW